MIFPPGIIMHELPQKNKYTNFKDITTSIVSQIDKNKLDVRKEILDSLEKSISEFDELYKKLS